MSDAMAEKKDAEVVQQKTAEQLATEEKQKRLWLLTIAYDPTTGETALMPNANVTKQGQLDTILGAATKQNELNSMARMLGSILANLLESKKTRKLFGG